MTNKNEIQKKINCKYLIIAEIFTNVQSAKDSLKPLPEILTIVQSAKDYLEPLNKELGLMCLPQSEKNDCNLVVHIPRIEGVIKMKE